MRIYRYCLPEDATPRWGRQEGDALLPWGDRGFEEAHSVADVILLPPMSEGRIFGIGRNYADHVEELNPGWSQPTPLVFMKPDSALVGHGQAVILPDDAGRVDYEGELALVIGRGGRRIHRHQALDHLLGLTCANDVSARQWQESDGQWIRAKGHDTFCPLGPWIETEADPADLGIRTWRNGVLVQDSRSSLMLRPPALLIAFLSSFCTLRPGDVILTGTPAGVGPMSAGDLIRIEIEGLGVLENPVTREDAHAR